jgi:hypothetical protein
MVTQGIAGRFVQVIWFCVVIHVLGVGAWGAYGGGSGTAEDPYLVFTPEQLNAIGTHPRLGQAPLMADIDLSGYRQMEFASGSASRSRGSPAFRWQLRTVSGFHWSSEFARYVGLFGLSMGNRLIELTMTDAWWPESGEYVAALVGLSGHSRQLPRPPEHGFSEKCWGLIGQAWL